MKRGFDSETKIPSRTASAIPNMKYVNIFLILGLAAISCAKACATHGQPCGTETPCCDDINQLRCKKGSTDFVGQWCMKPGDQDYDS